MANLIPRNRPGRPVGSPRSPGSGRVKGTLNHATTEIRELCRQHGPQIIVKLTEIAGLVPGVEGSQYDQCRILALRELLDRGYGRPMQPLAGQIGEPITVLIAKFGDGD